MTQLLLCTLLNFQFLPSSHSQILCCFHSTRQNVIDFRIMPSDHASSPASIGASQARVHAGLAPATSNDASTSFHHHRFHLNSSFLLALLLEPFFQNHDLHIKRLSRIFVHIVWCSSIPNLKLPRKSRSCGLLGTGRLK
jgi:hypothetical protein